MQHKREDISIREAETNNQRPFDLSYMFGDWTASWSLDHWVDDKPPEPAQRELEQWLVQKLDLPTEIPETKTRVDDVEFHSLEEFRENPVKTPNSGLISEIADVEWRESEQELIVSIRDGLTVSA